MPSRSPSRTLVPSDAEHDQLVKLRALIDACNASRRYNIDEWGRQTDDEHWLIPRGAWNQLVAASKEAAA